MKRRPATTVLLLAVDRTLRVDLDARGELVDGSAVELPSGPDAAAPDAVGVALSTSTPHAARVVVLDERLWTQTLELPRASLRGLPLDETARALAFELEPLSGIPAARTALGFTVVGAPGAEHETYWTTLADAEHLAALEAELDARGARLAALAHPAGLGPRDNAPRVEVWDGATSCVDPGPPRRTLVLASRPGQRSWAAALEPWLAAPTAAPVGWTGRRRPTELGEAAARVVDRGGGPHDGEGWPRWLASAGAELARGAAAPPVIRAAPRVRRPIGAGTLCATACLVAFATVAWLERGAEVRAAGLEERARAAQERIAGAKQEAASLSAYERRADELRARIASAEQRAREIGSEWEAQSKRILALASEVALRKPSGVALTSVEPDARGGLDVRGIGVDPRAIQAFAADLGPGLVAAGWRPRPASSVERAGRGGRRYFEFTIGVDHPSAPPDGAGRTAAAGAAGAGRRRPSDR